MIKKSLILLIALLLPLYSCCALAGTPQDQKQLLRLLPGDFYLGNKDAAVIFIEYSSLSCPHCADFHLHTFPQLKQDYIDTNKILYIRRDFITSLAAMSAAMVSMCSTDYFNMVEAMFYSQNTWAFNDKFNDVITSIALLTGMNKQHAKQCLDDETSKKKLHKIAQQASSILDITATPVFFINEHRIDGSMSYKFLARKIESQLHQ